MNISKNMFKKIKSKLKLIIKFLIDDDKNNTYFKALYANLAENYLSDADYKPGTVLKIGGEFEVTQTTSLNSTSVIGVVSKKPAYLMNSGLTGKHVVAIALTGRVPCCVVGKAEPGDILVSSNIPGCAIVSKYPISGSIIGKVLKNKNTEGIGLVEAVIGKL